MYLKEHAQPSRQFFACDVVSTSVCYFSTSFQRWDNVVVPVGRSKIIKKSVVLF